jgi:hypothetical protein
VLCLNETEVIVGPLNCTYFWQDGSVNQFYEVEAASYGVSDNNVVILTATNDLGCSYTDAFIFSIEDCIFVNEINALGFGIFPNPAVNAATISFESINEGRLVRVFNAAGQLVFQESTGARLIMELPLFSEAGIYLVEVLDGSNVQRSKLVVNP